MRLKVDENLPREICVRLQSAGHDAISVGAQGLGGAEDARIYQQCQDEQRALINSTWILPRCKPTIRNLLSG